MRLAFKAPLTAEEAVLIAGYLADAQRQGVEQPAAAGRKSLKTGLPSAERLGA